MHQLLHYTNIQLGIYLKAFGMECIRDVTGFDTYISPFAVRKEKGKNQELIEPRSSKIKIKEDYLPSHPRCFRTRCQRRRRTPRRSCPPQYPETKDHSMTKHESTEFRNRSVEIQAPLGLVHSLYYFIICKVKFLLEVERAQFFRARALIIESGRARAWSKLPSSQSRAWSKLV